MYLRYVLDEMSPGERAKVDEVLIADQEFSDSFQEAWHDLIDAYVADELPPEGRKRVEQAILSSKNGQTALSAARALHRGRAVPESANATPLRAANRSHDGKAGAAKRAFRIAVLVSTLAACFLLVFVFLHLRQRPMRQTAQESPPPSYATAGSTMPQKRGPAQSAVPSKASPSASRSVLRGGLLVVAMPMGPVRGGDAIPIHVPRGVGRIEVQWPVPPDSTASSYRLAIVSAPAGSSVLPQPGRVSLFGGTRVASFFLPASQLANGQAIFRITAVEASGSASVAEFPVRISR